MVPLKALNGRHITTTKCANGVERKRPKLAKGEMRESVERTF